MHLNFDPLSVTLTLIRPSKLDSKDAPPYHLHYNLRPVVYPASGLRIGRSRVRRFEPRVASLRCVLGKDALLLFPTPSDESINRGLVCVACTPSYTDFKDPDAHVLDG